MATHVELPATYSSTKRGIVSDVARTFDVLGWLSPTILPMKLLYRQLWQLKLDWDEEVPDDLQRLHKQWRDELHLLASVRLPRNYFHPKKKTQSITLHGFCDASQGAYAATIYIRATYASGPPTVNLVVSKTRVAPLKARTIPQLELCGAHLLAKLLSTTSKTLSIPMDDIFAYSDSTIVLAWLDGSPQRYKIYVANRIAKTINLIPPTTWRHVPTLQNPADCASRGITAKELVHHPLWWHGPSWLQQDPIIFLPQPAASKLKQLQDTEAKPQPQMCNLTVALPADQLETRSSSLLALIKVTCWIRRFIARAKQKNVPATLMLSRAEGTAAEDFLRQRSQARSFQAELQLLKANPPKPLSSKSSLLALHPFLDKKQLLRLGGRLNLTNLPEEQKHPIILSSSDVFSRLLLHHYHLQLSHGGPTALISHSGNLYHIVGVRRLARSVCSSCITCRKVAAKAGPQLMGQIPSSRLSPNDTFFNTGIDFAEPYTTSAGYTRKPVWLESALAAFQRKLSTWKLSEISQPNH